jgi:hypothetical protein
LPNGKKKPQAGKKKPEAENKKAAPKVVPQGEIAERVKSRVRKPVNYAV